MSRISTPQVPLGEFMLERGGSTDPAKRPDDNFVLYSIPAFDLGKPELVSGSEIGSPKKNVQSGDVLLSRIVPHIRRSWIVGEHPGEETLASGEWIVFRSQKVFGPYLRHFLVSDVFHPQLMMTVAGVGGSLLRAKPDYVAEITIPLPPLEEQRRIAAILDKADALRRKRKRALELLNALTQSIFLDMFGEAAENPNMFPSAKLGDLCDFRGGSQPPKSTFTYEPAPGWVRLIQIRDYKTDAFATYIPEALAKRPVSKTDVMIGRYGPPLFQILKGLEGSYNVALMKAEPRGGVFRSFLFHLLRAPRLQTDVISQSERSAGQTGVNLKFLNDYPAYIPPENLQTRFDQLVQRHEDVVPAAKKSMMAINGLFSSLQHRAFSGQL